METFHIGIGDERSLLYLLRAAFGAEVAEELPVADLPAGEVAAALPRQLGVDVPEEGFGRVPTRKLHHFSQSKPEGEATGQPESDGFDFATKTMFQVR